MARREYGLLCPEGHGVLILREDWTQRGVAWCPNEEHPGNGRFFRLQEVEEGTYDPDAPKVKSEWQLKREEAAAEAARQREERRLAEKTKKPKPASKARTRKEPRECKCGCGEMTKGGLFRPGHDAKYHSRLAKEQSADL